jgi:hypothetical protein
VILLLAGRFSAVASMHMAVTHLDLVHPMCNQAARQAGLDKEFTDRLMTVFTPSDEVGGYQVLVDQIRVSRSHS